jgi:hypothetical protein
MKDIGHWNQVCSSLDVIEDTTAAIDAYPPTWQDSARNDFGPKYLALYGLLQALFLQQDAVKHLCESLGVSFEPSDNPHLDRIREIRNDSIGHPTQRGGKTNRSHHFVSRPSLENGQFTLMSTLADGKAIFKVVDTQFLIADQRVQLSSTMSSLIDTLTQRVKEHRGKFMSDRFVDVFPPTLGYAFEKLFESFRHPERAGLGAWAADEVERVLTSFRAALQRQDMDIDTVESVELVYEELSYPVGELKKYLNEELSDIDSNDMAQIVTYYVKAKIDELRLIAIDLDT